MGLIWRLNGLAAERTPRPSRGHHLRHVATQRADLIPRRTTDKGWGVRRFVSVISAACLDVVGKHDVARACLELALILPESQAPNFELQRRRARETLGDRRHLGWLRGGDKASLKLREELLYREPKGLKLLLFQPEDSRTAIFGLDKQSKGALARLTNRLSL